MPDKHEVGGSSPLGPTSYFLLKKKGNQRKLYNVVFCWLSLPKRVTKWRKSKTRSKKKQEKARTKNIFTLHFNGGVAQLGEHLPCKQGVMGSNPIISTIGTQVPPGA